MELDSDPLGLGPWPPSACPDRAKSGACRDAGFLVDGRKRVNRSGIILRGATAVMLAFCTLPVLSAGGGTVNDPTATYSSSWRQEPRDGVVASVSLQLVPYELNSVAGKYKLIPILLSTRGRATPLPLDLAQDRLVITSDGKKVSASFQLSALDRALWDSLPQVTRDMLTYPEQLAANSAVVVYAFIPLADLRGRPSEFEYTIKALSAPLQLKEEEKKKAAALHLGFMG
jgi:hypothetical protein